MRFWMPWALLIAAVVLLLAVVGRQIVDRELSELARNSARQWLAAMADPAVVGLSSASPRGSSVISWQLRDGEGQPMHDGAGEHGTAGAARVLAWAQRLRGRSPGVGPEPFRLHVHLEHQHDVAHGHIAHVRITGPKGAGDAELWVDLGAQAAALERAHAWSAGLVALAAVLGGQFALRRNWRQRRARMDAEVRVHYLATHDVLTATLNRASFVERLQAAVRATDLGGAPFAVHCIDLDRFKAINDQHGHAVGDALLKAVGERLRASVPARDAVARLGGDEFAVLQHGVSDPAAAVALAEALVLRLSDPTPAGTKLLYGGASIGLAIYSADRNDDVGALLRHADAALYHVKSVGRGSVRLFDAELEAELQRRDTLVRDLRRALGEGQLRLAYQPIQGLASGALSGFEALMRWRHPVFGEVSPAVFIPLAEGFGMIEALGAWALRAACEEAASWPQPLRVSVNLSALQLDSGRLVAHVRSALAASGLAPGRLVLEITESLLMQHTDRNLEQLEQLHAMGVRVAMDDFGTGHSSMAYLWRFPFDKIKIDRAFVHDLNGGGKVEAVVGAIVALAHKLGIEVTAEGVETEAQLERLRSLGCDEVQGYLLGRPGLAADHFTAAREASRRATVSATAVGIPEEAPAGP